MGGILQLLSNLFAATKEVFGFAAKRSDLKNTAAMQEAAERQDEAKAVDATENAVAKEDINELRKEIAG